MKAMADEWSCSECLVVNTRRMVLRSSGGGTTGVFAIPARCQETVVVRRDRSGIVQSVQRQGEVLFFSVYESQS